jgi:outer membrane biosynthesis protein TonB
MGFFFPREELTEEEFARQLSAELDRGLKAVPLPAVEPERARYKAHLPWRAARRQLVPAALAATFAVLAGAITVAAGGPGPVTHAVEGALSNLAGGLQPQESQDSRQPTATPPQPGSPTPENHRVPPVQPQPAAPKPSAPAHTEQPTPAQSERPETPEPSERPETPKPKESQTPRPSPTAGDERKD